MMRPEEQVGKVLREKGYRLAAAESCTGGLIGHRITNLAKASTYYVGSITAYAYDAKVRLLGVKWETLEKFGAVSEPVVEEMAAGVCQTLAADAGIAVSGIAGPGGGTPEKPVGTVCFGIKVHDKSIAYTKHFTGNRQEIKEQTADEALNALLRLMNE